ncbi:MAG: hypothetical protein ABI175_18450, partial [Polyangiales bacterium]
MRRTRIPAVALFLLAAPFASGCSTSGLEIGDFPGGDGGTDSSTDGGDGGSCAPGYASCGAAGCVNPLYDPANCGACG